MRTMLFPTRGGHSSKGNQMRAIVAARERGAELLFLHVSDVHFLDHMSSPLLVDIEKVLDELSTFVLMIAQERAENEGVQARYTSRHGSFAQALRDVIQVEEIDLIGLGTPTGGTGLTTRAYLEELAQELADETGVEVLLFDAQETLSYKRAEVAQDQQDAPDQDVDLAPEDNL